MMKERIITPYIIFLLLSSMFSLALHQPDHVELPVDTAMTNFEQNPTPENFNRIENPTAADLIQVQHPTLENFQQLNAGEQALYLGQRYNNQFAVEFYTDSENVGRNQQLDDRYFSGDGVGSQSKSNIESNKPAATIYFREKYGKEYDFQLLTANFKFDITRNALTNHRQTIFLEQFRNREEILTIQAVADGFIFVETSRKVTVTGSKEVEVNYNHEMKRYEIGEATFTPLVDNQGQAGGDVTIAVQSDGQTIITGPAEGTILIGTQRVQYVNRRGTSIFSSNGDFSSENAEIIIIRKLYVDGASRYDAVKKEVQIWDHGDSDKGNIRNRNSIVIYQTVGVASQGQDGSLSTVKVHLDDISEKYSRHAPPSAESISAGQIPAEQQLQELRDRARALPPKQDDLGDNGEVWIQRTKSNEVIVAAKGKVDVGFYTQDHVLQLSQPYFRGQDGKAELDIKTNGNVNVDVRGKAHYVDDQYGTLAYNEGQVDVRGGVQSLQDGASIVIGRDSGKDTDILSAACFACTPGEAISLGKTITFGEPLADGGRLFSRAGSTEFTIQLAVSTDGSLVVEPSTSAMGKIAETLQGKTVVLERDLDLSVASTEKREQLLRLAKPAERESTLTAYLETYEDGKQMGPPAAIDLGIHEIAGDAILITSEKNKENALRLLQLLEQEKYTELDHAGLEFEADKDLRNYLLQNTRIDIELIDNPAYVEHLRVAVQKHQEFLDFKQRLQDEFGVMLDNDFRCDAPPDCQRKITSSLQKGDTLGFVYTAARIRALEAEKSELEALRDSQNFNGKNPPEVQIEINKNQQQISDLRRQREQWEQRDQQVQEIKSRRPPLGSFGAQVRAQMIHDGLVLGTEQLSQTEQEISQVQKELADLPTATKTVTREYRSSEGESVEAELQVSLSPEERAQETRRIQDTLTALARKKGELTAQIQDYQRDIGDLSTQYVAQRPDFAAELALKSGDAALARQIIEENVLPLSRTAAIELRREADWSDVGALEEALSEGDLARAAQQKNSIATPELAERAQDSIDNYYIAAVEKKLEEAHESSLDFRAERAAKKEDHSFLGRLDRFGRWGGGVVVDFTTAALLSEYSRDDPGYLELIQMQEQRTDTHLAGNEIVLQDYLDSLLLAQREGRPLTADLIKELHLQRQTNLAARGFIGSNENFLVSLEHQARGEPVDRELQAQVLLDEAMKKVIRQGGDSFVAEAEFEVLAAQFPETQAGQRAAGIDRQFDVRKGVFTSRFLDQYRDVAIQAASVDNFIPLATAAKFAGLGIRTGLATEKGIMLAAHLSEISAKISTATEFATGLSTVSDIAGAPLRGIQRALGTTGRQLADEVVRAERALLDAQASLDVNRILQSQKVFEDTRLLQQAHSAQQGSLLLRERGITAGHRAALREAREATDDFRELLRATPPSTIPDPALITAAQRVTETSERAANAYWFSKLEQRAVSSIRGASAPGRALQIQDDVRLLEESGVSIAPRQAEPIFIGCVACPRGEVFEYDLSRLPPGQRASIQLVIDRVEENAAKSSFSASDLVIDKARLDLLHNPRSVPATAQRVVDDLTAQAQGELSEILPAVTPQAVQSAVLDPQLLETERFVQDARRVAGSISQHDDLVRLVKTTDTGLPSRAAFVDDTMQVAEQGKAVQVATIDIQRFNTINDMFGHVGGDVFLREFGAELRASLQADGVKVYHKGGKTYKAVCVECQEDLSAILSRHIDAIRQRTVQRAQAVDRTLKIPVEEFNIYAGVSRAEKLPFADTFDTRKAEQLIDSLNQESLRAGKYGQLEICGKKELCTQIVKVGDVPQDLAQARVYQSPPDLEQRILLFDMEKRNEYSFFEEDVKFSDTDSLLFQRQRAELNHDLAEIKRLDYEILNRQMRDQHGFFKGNENFKAVVNYQLENVVDGREVVVVGGDEVGYFVSRQGQVTGARIDLNFFGTANRQLGVEKAEEIKRDALIIISNTLDDARAGAIVDDDTIIAGTIVERFNERMKKQDFSILADIEGQAVRVRPSLTVGFVKADSELIRLTTTGERNGASVLNKVADAAQEAQKRAGKQLLLQQSGEVKEINAAYFVAEGKILPADIEAIGPLVRKPTDQLVAEFILDGGDINNNADYLRMKAAPNLAAAREEAITGRVGQKVEEVVLLTGVKNVPERISETVIKTTPRVSLETLLEISPPQQINSIEATTRRTEILSRTMRNAEDMSVEDIKFLSQEYRERLVQSGIPDQTTTENLEDLIAYKSNLLKEDGFLDFVADIDNRFLPDTQKVMLGTDGMEYTSYTYYLLTSLPDPKVIPHYISRKTLATPEELTAIIEAALSTGKKDWELDFEIEKLQSIGTGKIRLYEDTNNVIIEAHRSQLLGGPRFERALQESFNEKVMANPQNRQRVIELIAGLRHNVDLNKPLVLVDAAGRAHVQSFVLKYGVEWLGNGENWVSLTREQQALLGGDLTPFREADIQFHLGIGRTGVTESNPLVGMEIDGVYMMRQDQDVVEKFRSITVDSNSIIQDKLLFIPTDAYDQANTLQRKLVIADAINDWKATHESVPSAVAGQ